MADIADVAQENMELAEALGMQIVHEMSKLKEVEATGACLWCDEHLPETSKRWCDSTCRDEWQKERDAICRVQNAN
jgi:hypothetical protein